MYEIPLLYAILSAPAKGVGLERGARVQIPLSALNLTEQAFVRIFLFVNFEKMFLNFENFCVITYYITH